MTNEQLVDSASAGTPAMNMPDAAVLVGEAIPGKLNDQLKQCVSSVPVVWGELL